jgi:hypothetical protein
MFGISTFWLSGASFRLAPQNFGGLLQRRFYRPLTAFFKRLQRRNSLFG